MGAHSMRRYAGRRVRIHLPASYKETRPEPYPLLLLHDGQNLFEDSTGPGGSWHAGRTVDRLVETGRVPPIVLVGIDHAGEHRIDEFTPTPAGRPDAGRAADYARFVVLDLVPQLAADYHVRADFNGLGLGGSSMGGLVTLWMASTFRGMFGRLLLMSPSLWWDRRVVLGLLRHRPLDPAPRVWLDAGRREGRSVVRDARQLHELLRRSNRRAARYVEDPEGDHSEVSWGRRFPEAIEWLYDVEQKTL